MPVIKLKNMDKKYNQQSQKDYQRSDNEDRSLVYRKWLRTVDADGFFCDIDFIKFKKGAPRAITELTRCDSEQVPNESYFKEITNRWYIRDRQAELIEIIAKKLQVPAYLIVYSKHLAWFMVWSLQVWKWKYMEPKEYVKWLTNL
jgi:hypothetical protein